LGRGGLGGYVIRPELVGASAAQLALRILAGENPAAIRPVQGEVVRPVFDWRQMQRWGVRESNLPAGSEIRFRSLTALDRDRWQIVSIAFVVTLQALLIAGLLYQYRRRRNAELEARQRLSELAHLNRHATAGELSASIAHELNQPLGAILNNTESAEILLKA